MGISEKTIVALPEREVGGGDGIEVMVSCEHTKVSSKGWQETEVLTSSLQVKRRKAGPTQAGGRWLRFLW